MADNAWVRKLERKLKEVGFEQQKQKSTSHRAFVLTKDVKTPCVVRVQATIKDKSRAAAIDQIIKNLAKAGASKAVLSNFKNYALGMLEAEETDTLDEIEEKLYSAISSNQIETAVKTAFLLGRAVQAVGDKRTGPTAIALIEKDKKEQAERHKIRRKLEREMLELFKSAVRKQLAREGSILIGYEYGKNNNIKFDDDIKHATGFNDVRVEYNGSTEFDGSGYISKKQAQSIFPDLEVVFYEVTIDNGSGEDSIYLDDEDDVGSLVLRIPQSISKEELENAEKRMKALQIKVIAELAQLPD